MPCATLLCMLSWSADSASAAAGDTAGVNAAAGRGAESGGAQVSRLRADPRPGASPGRIKASPAAASPGTAAARGNAERIHSLLRRQAQPRVTAKASPSNRSQAANTGAAPTSGRAGNTRAIAANTGDSASPMGGRTATNTRLTTFSADLRHPQGAAMPAPARPGGAGSTATARSTTAGFMRASPSLGGPVHPTTGPGVSNPKSAHLPIIDGSALRRRY
jgi:hypothetical protein